MSRRVVAKPAGDRLPEARVALYDRLIATLPGLTRRGAANPYTSVNGNMFTILSAATGTLAIRLPAADREAFVARYGTRIYEAHGRVLKEYVEVPDELLGRTDELAPYLERSYAYAVTLKPKATTRRRKV